MTIAWALMLQRVFVVAYCRESQIPPLVEVDGILLAACYKTDRL
ncbi:MAG: hypothetical protein QF660_04690 [Anaerolineales bacterium]|nr:hypothetical protein [Anaerolineales bacterium]